MNGILKKIIEKLYDNWHFIISIVIDIVVIVIVKYYKIQFWKANYYSDMLTAMITFVSIIISIFGVLMPTVFTGNNKMADYFKRNADIAYFSKSVKYIVICGFGSIGCICLMYLYDVIPKSIFIGVCILGTFSLCAFLLGAYRYLGIMLRLLIEDKKEYNGKGYKKQSSEQERRKLNDTLKKQNSK